MNQDIKKFILEKRSKEIVIDQYNFKIKILEELDISNLVYQRLFDNKPIMSAESQQELELKSVIGWSGIKLKDVLSVEDAETLGANLEDDIDFDFDYLKMFFNANIDVYNSFKQKISKIYEEQREEKKKKEELKKK